MDAIVSDTTALIVLAAQQRLDLLGACFERVLIPSAVYQEWRAGEDSLSRILEPLTFLDIRAVEEMDLLQELRTLVDPGEAEALALAKQLGLPLLIDEKKGRSLARSMGLQVFGLVGLLLLAVRRGVLQPSIAKTILDRARDNGFRLSSSLYQAFMQQLGGLS